MCILMNSWFCPNAIICKSASTRIRFYYFFLWAASPYIFGTKALFSFGLSAWLSNNRNVLLLRPQCSHGCLPWGLPVSSFISRSPMTTDLWDISGLSWAAPLSPESQHPKIHYLWYSTFIIKIEWYMFPFFDLQPCKVNKDVSSNTFKNRVQKYILE